MPIKCVGTCPEMQTNGTESIYASVKAVTTLVAPGPEVTKTIPGFPEDLAYPSAACPAPCSCLTKICLIVL